MSLPQVLRRFGIGCTAHSLLRRLRRIPPQPPFLSCLLVSLVRVSGVKEPSKKEARTKQEGSQKAGLLHSLPTLGSNLNRVENVLKP